MKQDKIIFKQNNILKKEVKVITIINKIIKNIPN